MLARGEAAATSPAKLDPESLALRSRPPRAIRFKRSVIIAIAAVGSIGLATVTWLALKPRLFHRASGQEEMSQPDQQRQQAEAAEHERQFAEVKAARESGLLVQNRQAAPPPEATKASVAVAEGMAVACPKHRSAPTCSLWPTCFGK